jgi:hypothetical protein
MANTPLIVNIFPSNIITLFYNIGNRIFVVRYVEKGHLILADALKNWLDFYIQLSDDLSAAGAQTLSVCTQGVHPATGALFALGLGYADGQTGEVNTGANLCAFLSGGPFAGGHDANFGHVQIIGGILDGLITEDGHAGL